MVVKKLKEDYRDQGEVESNILEKCKHDKIVRLIELPYGVRKMEADFAGFGMEFCDQGDLRKVRVIIKNLNCHKSGLVISFMLYIEQKYEEKSNLIY